MTGPCRALLFAALCAATLAAGTPPAPAAAPGEMLADPALEARARAITREIRCLVCQNQSIDDSDAELARDLRVIVRERITAGDGDDQVRQYLVARYGDFVLLDPPVKPATWLLWFGPPVLLLAGAIGVGLGLRRGAAQPPAPPVAAAERARLDAILAGDGEGPDRP